MSADQSAYAESPGNEETPPVEDGYPADGAAEYATVEEDDPDFVDRGSRSLDGPALELGAESQGDATPGPTPVGSEEDSSGDMAAGSTESAAAPPAAHPEQTGDWQNELSAHRVAVELRRIESDVRALLEERDPKRKRKLSGTSRWQELEEDIVSWRFSGRFDEGTLRRMQELIGRR